MIEWKSWQLFIQGLMQNQLTKCMSGDTSNKSFRRKSELFKHQQLRTRYYQMHCDLIIAHSLVRGDSEDREGEGVVDGVSVERFGHEWFCVTRLLGKDAVAFARNHPELKRCYVVALALFRLWRNANIFLSEVTVTSQSRQILDHTSELTPLPNPDRVFFANNQIINRSRFPSFLHFVVVNGNQGAVILWWISRNGAVVWNK